MRIVTFTLLVLAALALAGCVAPPGAAAPTATPTPAPPRACTLIGCVDGLTVRFTGTPRAGLKIEATAPGYAPVKPLCPSDDPAVQCPAGEVFLPDFAPEEVTLHITWDGGEMTQTLKPVYTESRPNGPDCPPVCRQGVVTIEL